MFIIQAANLPFSAKAFVVIDQSMQVSWTDDRTTATQFLDQDSARKVGLIIRGFDWVIQAA